MSQAPTSNAKWPVYLTAGFLAALPLGCGLVYNSTLADAVLTPRLLWLAGCCLVLALLALGGKRTGFQHGMAALLHPISLAWLGWVVVSAATIGWATNQSEAWYEFARMSVVFLTFLLLAQAFRSRTLLGAFALGANVLVPIISIVCLYQLWWLDAKPFSHQLSLRVEATFANQNILAMAYLLLLPWAAWWSFTARKAQKWLGWANVLQILVALVLIRVTGTAVGLLVFGAVLAASLLTPSLLRETAMYKLAMQRKTVVVGLLAVLLVSVSVGAMAYDKIANGWNAVANYNRTQSLHSLVDDSSLNDRTIMLHNTLDLISDNFPSGIGLSDWAVQFQQYGVGGTTYINQGWLRFLRPHNDFLWVLAETGAAGLALYAAVFVAGMVFALRWASRGATASERILALLTTAGLAAYITCAMLYFPKERFFPSLLLASMLAMIVARTPRTVAQKRLAGLSMLVAIVIGCGAILSYGINRLDAEKDLNIAVLAKADGNWPVCAWHAQRALDAGLQVDATATPVAWYMGIALLNTGQPQHALGPLLEAEQRNPYHISVLSDVAGCYAMIGQPQKSITYYQKALGVTPCYPDALKNLAVVLYSQNQIELACATLHQDCLRERWELPEYREMIATIFSARKQQLPNATAYAGINEAAVFKIFTESLAANRTFEAQLDYYLEQNG